MKKLILLIALFITSITLANNREPVKPIQTVKYGIDGTKTQSKYIPFKRTVPKNAKIIIPFKRF